MIDDLYSAKILRLVANIPHAGRLDAPDATSEKLAKLCGSRITIDVQVSEGRVSGFAQDVRACALGQASAAILGQNVIGASLDEIEVARDGLRAMLKDGAGVPAGRFAELCVLQPVKDYPARHASTLLAFEAAAEAVQKATQAANSGAIDTGVG